MRARLVLLALTAPSAAGCGGDEPAETTAGSTPTPNPTMEPEASEPGSAANAFIGSLGVDPADGTLLIGTGFGLFRAGPGAEEAERVVGELTTPDGSGPVSRNLVIRFAAPGELVGSGHPDESGTPLPEDLGLMRFRDTEATWQPMSMLGDADSHLRRACGDHVVAVRVEAADVEISTDGGRSFKTRAAPDLPVDVAFDPQDPSGCSSPPPRAPSARPTAAARGARATRSGPSSSPGRRLTPSTAPTPAG